MISILILLISPYLSSSYISIHQRTHRRVKHSVLCDNNIEKLSINESSPITFDHDIPFISSPRQLYPQSFIYHPPPSLSDYSFTVEEGQADDLLQPFKTEYVRKRMDTYNRANITDDEGINEPSISFGMYTKSKEYKDLNHEEKLKLLQSFFNKSSNDSDKTESDETGDIDSDNLDNDVEIGSNSPDNEYSSSSNTIIEKVDTFRFVFDMKEFERVMNEKALLQSHNNDKDSDDDDDRDDGDDVIDGQADVYDSITTTTSSTGLFGEVIGSKKKKSIVFDPMQLKEKLKTAKTKETVLNRIIRIEMTPEELQTMISSTKKSESISKSTSSKPTSLLKSLQIPSDNESVYDDISSDSTSDIIDTNQLEEEDEINEQDDEDEVIYYDKSYTTQTTNQLNDSDGDVDDDDVDDDDNNNNNNNNNSDDDNGNESDIAIGYDPYSIQMKNEEDEEMLYKYMKSQNDTLNAYIRHFNMKYLQYEPLFDYIYEPLRNKFEKNTSLVTDQKNVTLSQQQLAFKNLQRIIYNFKLVIRALLAYMELNWIEVKQDFVSIGIIGTFFIVILKYIDLFTNKIEAMYLFYFNTYLKNLLLSIHSRAIDYMKGSISVLVLYFMIRHTFKDTDTWMIIQYVLKLPLIRVLRVLLAAFIFNYR